MNLTRLRLWVHNRIKANRRQKKEGQTKMTKLIEIDLETEQVALAITDEARNGKRGLAVVEVAGVRIEFKFYNDQAKLVLFRRVNDTNQPKSGWEEFSEEALNLCVKRWLNPTESKSSLQGSFRIGA